MPADARALETPRTTCRRRQQNHGQLHNRARPDLVSISAQSRFNLGMVIRCSLTLYSKTKCSDAYHYHYHCHYQYHYPYDLDLGWSQIDGHAQARAHLRSTIQLTSVSLNVCRRLRLQVCKVTSLRVYALVTLLSVLLCAEESLSIQ